MILQTPDVEARSGNLRSTEHPIPHHAALDRQRHVPPAPLDLFMARHGPCPWPEFLRTRIGILRARLIVYQFLTTSPRDRRWYFLACVFLWSILLDSFRNDGQSQVG